MTKEISVGVKALSKRYKKKTFEVLDLIVKVIVTSKGRIHNDHIRDFIHKNSSYPSEKPMSVRQLQRYLKLAIELRLIERFLFKEFIRSKEGIIVAIITHRVLSQKAFRYPSEAELIEKDPKSSWDPNYRYFIRPAEGTYHHMFELKLKSKYKYPVSSKPVGLVYNDIAYVDYDKLAYV